MVGVLAEAFGRSIFQAGAARTGTLHHPGEMTAFSPEPLKLLDNGRIAAAKRFKASAETRPIAAFFRRKILIQPVAPLIAPQAGARLGVVQCPRCPGLTQAGCRARQAAIRPHRRVRQETAFAT